MALACACGASPDDKVGWEGAADILRPFLVRLAWETPPEGAQLAGPLWSPWGSRAPSWRLSGLKRVCRRWEESTNLNSRLTYEEALKCREHSTASRSCVTQAADMQTPNLNALATSIFFGCRTMSCLPESHSGPVEEDREGRWPHISSQGLKCLSCS